jgi:hypothetical protein
MDVARTFDALCASARSGQVIPCWWCLSDATELAQARAYCQTYQPFWRHDTWGSALTRQVVRFTLPQPSNQHVTEASCNAIGFALLAQMGLGWTGKRTGIGDKEERLPYYFDIMSIELVVLDGADAFLQQGTTEPRLRRREVLWLQNLFNRPAYVRPESTGITRILGNKQGLSIPVVVLGNSTICQLLVQMEIAGTPDRTSLPEPEQVDAYGPPAEAGTLTLQDLNQVRAYLRLPRLTEGSVRLEAYSAAYSGEPAFGIARWEGRQVLFKAIESSVDVETGNEGRQTRYVLLEATAQQLEESIARQHHLHPSEVRNQAVIGWFERQDALLEERLGG